MAPASPRALGRSRTAQHVVADEPTQGVVRFFDVVSSDGTVLRGWSNDVDGTREAAGEPAVLLCNGLGTNAWCWPALLAADSGVRVVSWNHRGTGGSQRPRRRDRIGIEAFVDDALAVLERCDLDAVPVVGWSMGVNTAFELAHRHPARVLGLLAVGGVPGRTFSTMLEPLHVPRFARETLTVNAARVMGLVGGPLAPLTTRIRVGHLGAQVLSHSGFMLPTPDVDNTARAVSEFLRTPMGWYMRLAVAAAHHDRVPLSSITVPTTFMAGSFDVLAGADDMYTASRRMNHAQYVEYAASHFLPLELPGEVHEHLLELLDLLGLVDQAG